MTPAVKLQKNYQIMSTSDVIQMYRQTITEAQNKAELFYGIHQNKIYYPHDKEETISLLKKIILASAKYNLNETEYLFKIIHSETQEEAQKILLTLKKEVQATYDNFQALEEIGLIRRTLYGIRFPKIFSNNSRIYLRTKPILSETELMQDIVGYLNYPLLRNEKFSFFVETKNDDKNKKNKRIWLHQKQNMKPVAKLHQFETEGAHLLKLLEENEEFKQRFFRFITKIPNTDKLSLYFSKFKKNKDFPPFRLDIVLLRHLKAYQLKNTDELISALQNINQKIKIFHTSLSEMLVKPLSDCENETGIDTIILSTDPKDISSMSTFVQWESCMSNGGLYFQDVMMQIGTGSIIAYGVNSQNPQKKLSRILLKPFETAKTLRQRSYHLTNIDIDVNFPEIQLSKNLLCDYEDMNQVKKKFVQEETAHLDEEDLILDPFHVERIYKIDKTYGLQNKAFKEILETFINDHLNTNTTPGTYMVVDSMYLDSLNQSYQIYDRYDKDNLIKYLIYNKIPYHFESNGVIHTTNLNLCNVPNIHLRPLKLKTLRLNGHMIDQEIKNVTVEKLFIEQADTIQRKNFPENLTISGTLFFENSPKQFDMPFGIKAPVVSASNTKLISVSPNLQTQELLLSSTGISTLPPLKLNKLDISDCTRLKGLPDNIVVTEYLDASNNSLCSLPAIQTRFINLKNTKNLTHLHPQIKFEHLKATHSALSVLPKNLTGATVQADFSKICEIPCGTVFEEMSLNATPLVKIHPSVQIHSLSINNTPIASLPDGLKFYKLSAENCQNLLKLPSNIQIEGTLNLSGAAITFLPRLDTQNIHITRCKNISFLSNGTTFQNLFAAQSGLKTLPKTKNANIVMCYQSALENIPDDFKAHTVDVRHTPLTKIGDNVMINTLNISHTPIESINPSLKVLVLEAVNCHNLTHLSLENQETQKINLTGSNIQTIHSINTQILNISHCHNFKTFGKNIFFRDLIAENSSLSSLMDHLCAKEVNISGCPIEKLPENITVQKLDATSSQLKTLPKNICAEELILNDTKISIIPPDIQVKVLHLQNTSVHTIYYSPHFQEIVLNQPVKFIHPCIPNQIIKGMSLSQIKQAKHNFKQARKKNNPVKSSQNKQTERE